MRGEQDVENSVCFVPLTATKVVNVYNRQEFDITAWWVRGHADLHQT